MKSKLFNLGYVDENELIECNFKKIGNNVKIHQSVNIIGFENISFGNNVRIDAFTTIIATGPVTIGSYIHIAAYCLLSGGAGLILEDFCGISHGTKIFSKNDDYSGNFLTGPTVPAKYLNVKQGVVQIGKHVVIGANSVILPGVTIGNGSAVGALSLVNRSLEPAGIYSGIPAKKIKNRNQELFALEAQLMKETQ